MSTIATKTSDDVKTYYERFESRLGYNLLMGGTKHFGYYPKGKSDIKEKQALVNMEQLIIEKLELKTGDNVLDAGCGQGRVACRLAKQIGCQITGITVVPFEVEDAERFARKFNVSDSTVFAQMDFTKTTFTDDQFDAIYMMESIVHAYELYQTVYEMYRVLRPDGRIVIFYYSIPNEDLIKETLNPNEIDQYRSDLEFAIAKSHMPALVELTHGALEEIMAKIGFESVSNETINKRVRPSLARLNRYAKLPNKLHRITRTEDSFVNTTIAANLFRWPLKYPDLLRYNVTTAHKGE